MTVHLAKSAKGKHLSTYLLKWETITIALLVMLLNLKTGYCQLEDGYDEVPITLSVQGIGNAEIPAIIHEQSAYLAIKDFFDFLKIKNDLSPGLDSLTGFFLNPKATFLIDKSNNRIVYDNKIVDLKEQDLIQTLSGLYLKDEYFGSVFGLECTFSFHSLSVALETKIELPAIREMQQDLLRQGIGQQNIEPMADTIFKRNFSWFHLGMANWLVIASQELNGRNYARMNLGLGGIIAGGEASAYLNYNSGAPFSEKEQYYLWRYANNDHQGIRQVLAGKIFTQSISSIYDPVVGIQLTNAPTFYRKSFETYTLSNYTEPNWVVELFVNNVLVDFVKADASGFFTFNVPLSYGITNVTLHYYGPWGEEKISRQSIDIPFNFLPQGELEYRVSAGAVEDPNTSLYSQARVNYGLTRNITVGGGMEYYSALSAPSMPFLNASIRLPSNLILAGEYVHGVKSGGILTYHSPSNLQFQINYTQYKTHQEAVKYNYTQEAKASVSMPFHFRKVSAFSRLTINPNILNSIKYSTTELLLSAGISKVNINILTSAFLMTDAQPYIYGSVALSILLPKGITLTPKMQYDYTHYQIHTANLGIEKRIFRFGFINATIEQNFDNNVSTYQVGFRYDFSFGHIGLLATQNNHVTQFAESASGSLIYEPEAGYLSFNRNSNIGRGGMIIIPFLDVNGNGKYDKDERRVSGLSLQVNGASIRENQRDTSIIVSGLEPYINYLVQLNSNSFQNIAWRIDKPTILVSIIPNQLRAIEIPISIVGEASGMVYLKESNEQNNLGGIRINFYKNDSILVATTLTEEDGFFDFLGLAPRIYSARIDESQLSKLGLSANSTSFTIQSNADGDVVDNLEFFLEKK